MTHQLKRCCWVIHTYVNELCMSCLPLNGSGIFFYLRHQAIPSTNDILINFNWELKNKTVNIEDKSDVCHEDAFGNMGCPNLGHFHRPQYVYNHCHALPCSKCLDFLRFASISIK